MKILLDTCEFLWLISGDPSLPPATKQEIQNPQNEIFLSVVSLWEIIIKHGLGKLPLPEAAESYIPTQREKHGILSLYLRESAVKRLRALPALHRDPFDRMLICQTQDEDMHSASSDPIIARYPVRLL